MTQHKKWDGGKKERGKKHGKRKGDVIQKNKAIKYMKLHPPLGEITRHD